MGSLFSQKLVKCSVRKFTDWAKPSGVAIVRSSPSGLLDYKTLRWMPHPSPGFGEGWVKRPVALLIGSEKRGLSGRLIEASDFMVRIPMRVPLLRGFWQGACAPFEALLILCQ